jgi:hypothetical protein
MLDADGKSATTKLIAGDSFLDEHRLTLKEEEHKTDLTFNLT